MKNYCPPGDLLHNKLILVTGAGDGIGRQAALSFAQHGATVILLGRTQEKLERVYDEIQQMQAPEAIIHPLDLALAGTQDYTQLATSIEQQFPALDGLLHNASILGPMTPVEFYPAEIWHKVMQTNLNSAFQLTQALLPSLRAAVSGRIVFTSSGVGHRGKAYWGAYAVSKFATEGLMQVLADELRESSAIRVNCINPGATRTAMRKAAFPAEDPHTLPTAETLMPLYLYLMGQDSATVQGQSLNAREWLASEK
ncbi:MAG: YciK family oxidoreductase [Pseudomonadales bacterium]|nr:YciK family oxidoreductase [Pseudomonadales bacterium]